MRYLYTLLLLSTLTTMAWAQDTITIQTLTYDSTGRDYFFNFPQDDGTTYGKVIMEYSMRCKDARVSTGTNRNQGCGEWDYSCNTFIVDESRQDSVAAKHPTHRFGGWNDSELPYVSDPTYAYHQYDLSAATVVDDTNVEVAQIPELDDLTIDLSENVTRFRQVFEADALFAQGVQSGPIHGLRLPAKNVNTYERVRISLYTTDEDDLSSLPLPTALADAQYHQSLETTIDGSELWFCEPIEWDGLSNLMLDIVTVRPAQPTALLGLAAPVSQHSSMWTTGSNQYLELDGSTYYDIDPAPLAAITNEVTVEFWAYGNPDVQPVNNSILEGTDDSNLRELNIHLPWSNGQVYWDCGNEGGYDRINKVVLPEVYAGSWHHWAFTKNASTGRMAIYLDGELFHEGSGKTNSIDLTQLRLGSSNEGNNIYPGYIDELRIFPYERAAETIKSDMRRSGEDNLFDDPQGMLYNFTIEGSGDDLASTTGTAAVLASGSNRRTAYLPGQSINGYIEGNILLAAGFMQGDVDVTCSTEMVTDAVPQSAITVQAYTTAGTDIVVDSTYQVYAATTETTYDIAGSIVSTTDVTPEGTITVGELDYYSKSPMRFEIMSFVTPYGIGIDFGEEGRTWTFDVTDYTPILNGRKRMFLGNGGQFQEEMDIRFHFIKGTPPRDILDITQIWRPGSMCNYTNIAADNCFEPRMITPRPDAAYLKVRSMVTGHGQEGEFIPRTHYLNINGLPEIDWQAWKECADNPIYPQGGTWIYDRAGWCPGMATDLQEFELEDFIEPGEAFEIDYSMSTATGDSRYLVNHQLVTYGEYNNDYDVAIEAVMRPSDRVEYGRYNPTCDQPTIVLRNQGAERITSATITYTMGGETMTHTWTGSLRPERTREVALPNPSLATLAGISPGKQQFEVEVTSINDGDNMDGNTTNNYYVGTFDMPEIYNAEEYVLQLRTNNVGNQNSLTIKDYDGNNLISRSTLLSNTNYRDTLRLDPGCYTIELIDRGDNGIDFWAQPGDGSGAMRLRGDNTTLIDFEPDFGRSLSFAFIVSEVTNVKEVSTTQALAVYPNPANDYILIDLATATTKAARVTVIDQLGKVVIIQDKVNTLDDLRIDVSNLTDGIYSVSTVDENRRLLGTGRFIKL
jgi:hypothetical protein